MQKEVTIEHISTMIVNSKNTNSLCTFANHR